ncbi:MAG: hypothetical protein L0211_19855 [Planctomycetaceae bacterium]|nr:hypothetical protein [Planctomycetaceae bacterium]
MAPPAPQLDASASKFTLHEPAFVVPTLALIVAMVVLILSVFNATMVPVAVAMEPGPAFAFGLGYMSLLLGSIGGQAAVVTVLAVWGTGPLWQRLVWHWVLVLVAFSAWTFGFVVAMNSQFGRNPDFPEEEFFTVLLGLPLLALACQAVPWMLKFYFNWRIEQEGEDPPAADRRLSIRDMIVGTVVVALTMAAVRIGKPANAAEGSYWMGWLFAVATATGISLVCLVPMVYFTLGVRRAWMGAIEVAALAATVAAVGTILFIMLNPGGPSDKKKRSS